MYLIQVSHGDYEDYRIAPCFLIEDEEEARVCVKTLSDAVHELWDKANDAYHNSNFERELYATAAGKRLRKFYVDNQIFSEEDDYIPTECVTISMCFVPRRKK